MDKGMSVMEEGWAGGNPVSGGEEYNTRACLALALAVMRRMSPAKAMLEAGIKPKEEIAGWEEGL